MLRRTLQPPRDDAPDESGPPVSADVLGVRVSEPDLAALPIVGITRRRLATILGVLLAAWIVVIFARQVGDAAAATGRAEAMITANAARRSEIAGLEAELVRIQQQRLRPRRVEGDRLHPRPGRAPARRERARVRRAAGRGAVIGQPTRTLADAPVRSRRLIHDPPGAP